MSTYEPGTVADITISNGHTSKTFTRAFYSAFDGQWISPTAGRIYADGTSDHWNVTDVRPLVVLDDRNEYRRVADMLRETAENFFVPDAAALALKVADQIEAQTKPPRIPEPGLWGVVTAGHKHLDDGRRSQFVRVATTGRVQWVECEAEADWCTWDALVDPVLVREGVTTP